MSAPVLLIVDDEERILSAMRRSLRREGYSILTAATPREALTLLETTRIDCVMSDHRMPGMNGDALLLEAARLQPRASRILITGWSEALAPEEIERIGVLAMLPKPWDDAELKRTLRDAMRSGRSALAQSPMAAPAPQARGL